MFSQEELNGPRWLQKIKAIKSLESTLYLVYMLEKLIIEFVWLPEIVHCMLVVTI